MSVAEVGSCSSCKGGEYAAVLEHVGKLSEIKGEEDGDEGGVELGAGAPAYFGQGDLARHGRAVGASGAHGVEGVGQRQDARDEGDVLAGEFCGVAGAVPAFVVMEDALEDEGNGGNTSEDSVADLGMPADLGVLIGVEAAGLAEDVFGDADLADIVEQAGDAVELDLRLVEVECDGHLGRQEADAFGMSAGVAVLGVDAGAHGLEHACEEEMLFGEAGHVLVEDAEEVGSGLDEFHFGAADIGVGAVLAAADEQADGALVVCDRLSEDLGVSQSGQGRGIRLEEPCPVVRIGVLEEGQDGMIEGVGGAGQIAGEDQAAGQIRDFAAVGAEAHGEP